jgi:hypothetical protein
MKEMAICSDGGNGGEEQTGLSKITVRLFGGLNTVGDNLFFGYKKNPRIIFLGIF